MFTMKDLNKILPEVKGLRTKSVFSPKKNRLCYRLSKMNSQYRGTIIERMIRDTMLRRGKKVQHIGGNHGFDLVINGKKVEVKSSLAMPNSDGATGYSYQFQNIKIKKFDMLIIVFISPEGITMRQMSKKVVARYLKGTKHYSNGQTLRIGPRSNQTIKSAA